MAVWFGAIGIFTLFSIFLTNDLLPILVGFGMMAAGSALVATCKWFSRNDAKWLSDVIREALSAQVLAHPAFAPDVKSPTRRPMVLTIVAGALTLGAVMSLLGTVLGIQSVETGSDGLNVTYFPGAHSRYVTVFLSIAMLVLAVGVYRRRLLAWRAGFGLLGGSLIYSVASMLSMRTDQIATVAFCVGSLVVAVLWGFWWHGQRIHFQD
jgi:hypothetical protein